MALKFKKPAGAKTEQSAPAPAPAPVSTPAPATSPKAALPPKQKANLKFIKRGTAATAAIVKEEKRVEQKMNQLYGFWMKPNSDTSITFVDGNLDGEVLDIPFIYQHHLNMNGKWGNFFICTQEVEPCPICEGGNTPSFVGVLTIIDHTEFQSKRDGLMKKDQIRLFYAKRDTIKQLQKLAAKRGGLAGCTFEVSRTGDKSPSTGNQFDFVDKKTPAQMKAVFGDKANQPDYDKILAGMFISAKDLRKMGFGSMAPVGAENSVEDDDFEGEM
jgi:hypothetical protein